MKTKISAEEAINTLAALPVSLSAESVGIFEAAGRVLAEDVFAVVNVPPFDRSPYDGYALMASDTASASSGAPVTLCITEELPAGTAPTVALTHGTAAKVLTGAPVPEGADAVVKYEETEFTDTEVKIFSPAKADSDIVRAGEDVKEGTLLASKGTVLTPALAGLMAGQGLGSVKVCSRPVVTVISTGSELLEPGQPVQPAKIYNSNVCTISSYLAQMGAKSVPGGSVADDPDSIAQRISAALETSDMVVTTGGASVGDYDYAVRAAEKTGANVLFWKAAFKPGGSMMAAVKDGKLILSLSGNPGAAIIGLLYIAAPYIKRLCGRSELFHECFTAVLKDDFKKKSPQLRLVRGSLSVENGVAYFVEKDGQGNGVVSSFVGCDLLGEIPAGTPPLKAGEKIKAYRLER